jgi:hypothetical protein
MAFCSALYLSARFGCDRENGILLSGTSSVDEEEGGGGTGDVDRCTELAKGCIDLAPVEVTDEIVP